MELKPLPLTMAWVTLSAALPVFVMVTDCKALLPTFTLPKAMLAGFTLSPGVAESPVPEREIEVGEFGALLTSEMLPITLPATAGAKRTVKLLL